MKKITLLIIVFVLFSIIVNSQNLRAYLSYSVFNTPDNEPYIETYLTVNGKSIIYEQLDDGSYQGTLEVQILFKQGDSIVNYSKYELSGPNIDDTIKNNVNMLDIQRYALPIGEYNIEISLRDKNSDQKEIISYDKFTIDFVEDNMDFSDIELLSSYKKADEINFLEKNGYELTPYIFNYYPQSASELSFYAELYNSKVVLGDDAFLITYYLRPFEVDKKLDQYFHRKRVNPEQVIVLLSSFDISELPSGNYLLVIEARDRLNELLVSKETFFQRYNPSAQFNLTNLLVLVTQNTFVDKLGGRDTLAIYIDYLTPISTDIERIYAENQFETADIEELRKYFLNFWLERDRLNPEMAWNDYLLRVKQANKNFKSVSQDGYQTDRGRVYLQYGQPNVISEQYFEPAAYPYEIWHYYQLNGQRDKKFVFYTHDLATNDFQLIHSNAVGELNNYRWETIIYRRTWDPNSIDDAIIPSTWGGKATETYRQPW
ncbi:MAG: GWxTD domain-containing protein [Bacteroidetes bacterium]|nr:GWxTD domain-containing protein [Bacteroidota bacterium]MBL6944014.1 GWxTD domain-containing protein [Bacteroidales bacterium]